MVEEFNQLAAREIEEVREEWGADFDKNSEIMKRGFRAAELSQEQLENLETALGSKAFMQMGKRLGDLISEKGVPGLKTAKRRTTTIMRPPVNRNSEKRRKRAHITEDIKNG